MPNLETSTPDKDSYLGDPNRSGLSHGEAIFGDKQAQFEGQTTPAEEITAAYEAAKADTAESAKHAAAILAINQSAETYNWDEARIAAAKAELESKTSVNS